MPTFAWQSINPFDLTPRLQQPDKQSITLETLDTGNPFDLIAAPPSAPRRERPAVISPARKSISDASKRSRFVFGAVMTVLVSLTLLTTLFRGFFSRSWQAFINENMLNQFFREREGVGGLPYFFLYGFFFVNVGLFAWFTLDYFHINIRLSDNHFVLWLCYTFGFMGLFLAKHLLLSVVGLIFPIQKETAFYSFVIMIFSIIIGLLFVPVNLALAYGPASIRQGLLYGTLLAIGLIYLYRVLRGLIIANRFLLFHKFHFLLYICSVEIAPVMILVKLLRNEI
ncbi:MAG TPA: DUF4271 domain-containing protein [Saprospiraceae bacterium]|nr:DUF4271 domain-containing protein [Saprospiraceae bacterium]HMP13005.1 DUF4271 domain-containing protein [Saprospiraceae bacterium]